MSSKVSYDELQQTMNKLDAQISAAEAHGLLVGMFCMSPGMQDAVWQAALLDSLDCSKPSKKQLGVFSKVAAQIVADFRQQDFTLNLLLPNDDLELRQRVVALGDWCRGYLSGLGLVGLTGEDLKNEVIKELVHDLSQIAHVDMQTDSSEEDEHNYMELVEYLRIAVQNIQFELHGIEKTQVIH